MPSNIEYEVRYRKIRYPRLEFKTGNLVLVLPLGYKDEASLLKRHERWINSRIAMINVALEESKNLTLVMRTKEEFHYVIKKLLHKYEKLLGKKINKIYFRRMRSKWASYSTKNNITINTMMQYLPDELLSYVVFHELLHTEIRKHNANFWRNIERRFSNHDELEMQLLYYWFLLQKEMTQSQMNKI
jgi:predicted metal-dependent hydrolase